MRRLRSWPVILASLLAFAFVAAAAAAQEKRPAGATLRLGSTRFRDPGAGQVAYSPDGKVLITGGGHVQLWDAASGRLLRRLPIRGGLRSMALVLPHGKTLATLTHDDAVRFWDLATGNERGAIPSTGIGFHCFAVSPDGKTVATGNGNLETQLWDIATGALRHTFRGVPPGAKPLKALTANERYDRIIRDLVFSPDGKFLAARCADGMVRVYDMAARQEVRRLTRKTYCYAAPVFSPDSKLLITGGLPPAPPTSPWTDVYTLTAWDVATGRKAFEFAKGGVATTLTFSPDGKLLAVGGSSLAIRLYEVARLTAPAGKAPAAVKELRKLVGHLQGMSLGCDWQFCFSPDGRTLAGVGEKARVSADPDREPRVEFSHHQYVVLWDVATGRHLGYLGPKGDQVRNLDFSPDGECLVYRADTAGGSVVRLMDTGKRKQLREWARTSGGPLLLSPEGKLMLTGGRVLDLASGLEVANLGENLATAAFSPRGRRLLTATTGDATLLLRDVARLGKGR